MKIFKQSLLSVLLAFIFNLAANCQVLNRDISGSWLGKIATGGIELRVVFNIADSEDGGLMATMDSPDQGARDIPTGKVTFSGDSLRIEVPVAMGFYAGILDSDSTITGIWSQGGMSLELDLKRQTGIFELKRPQEPKPPYPYLEEEVIFQNITDGIKLSGTLTIPEGMGPFPAVILISGSGSQNRDEEIFGHKPFKVLADHLTRNGIAVLRYDDRGVGGSGGTPIGTTSYDFYKDALGAFEYLLERNNIDKDRVGVIGHSEGGIIAQVLASSKENVAFIVSLAGPGVDGRTIIVDQADYISRLSGIPEETIEENNKMRFVIHEILMNEEDTEIGLNKIREYVKKYYTDLERPEDIDVVIDALAQQINAASYPWWRYFLLFDPGDYLPKIKCSFLALNGEKDCQVLAEKNISAIVEILTESGNKNFKGLVIKDLNHMFQLCETGLPTEYGEIEETFHPEALTIISDWILNL